MRPHHGRIDDAGMATTTPTASPAAPTPASPTTGTAVDPDGRWRRYSRRVFAVLLLVVGTGAWLLGQTFFVFLFAPTLIVVGAVVHRIVAARQGRLATGFLADPLAPSHRRHAVQLVVRAGLGAAVVLAAQVALIDIHVGGLPSPGTQQLLIWIPVVAFVALQLIPGRTVSKSLNAVGLVALGFLGFQLVQVHAGSGLDDAVDIAAPFEGEWYVPSAGRSSLVSHHWTPLADQLHAVDFVVERDGRTHDGEPDDLASYYCWNQPILAPADGTVVAAVDGHADVPIGETDGDHPAGNVVVIEIGSTAGGDAHYALLAHLREGSVAVEVGDIVSAGDEIGRCGNTGHSLEPHLHIQIQDSPLTINEHMADPQGDIDTFPMRITDATHIRDGNESAEQTSWLRRNDRVRTD